ncbi:acyltransferase family protein [Uliginosibacterium sp. 31-12]|uniref:acyltransferase family protein n=1 Tax=Uliginosibacterium sp. 31-12 TaxID=3062781 RepID=UPI0026E2F923|nr:acyltransferase family protein [Uliginosibacterium sp. 31-12]MDO6386053.1 acyltransferase family protein [Uliginosibacterium sp. 31-12]
MKDVHLRWIDAAKGVGIVLVVYGHVARGLLNAGLDAGPWMKMLDAVIYSFHMPLFFILSGYLLEGSVVRHGWNLVAKRAGSLLYPFVVWSLLQGGIEVLLSRHKNFPVSIEDVLLGLIFPRQQFWYLYALFFLTAASIPLLVRRRSPYVLTLFFAGAACAAVYLDLPVFIPPLAYVAGYWVFILFGVLLCRYGVLEVLRSYWVGLALMATGAQFLLLDYQSVALAGHSWLWLGMALLCACAVVAVCLKMPPGLQGPLCLLGAASLEIFLMHVIFAAGIRIVLMNVFGIRSAVLHLVLGVLAGLVLPCLIKRLAANVWGGGSRQPRWFR